MNSRGFTIWMTGLSGAGKSTIAERLVTELGRRGLERIEVLDGDEVRKTLSVGAGFSKEERDAHVRRMAYVAHLLTRNGIPTIVAAISPYAETREYARRLIGDFVEVFVTAPLAALEARDPKGLYRRARAGLIPQFTGISDPYEPPENPAITCYTDREQPEDSTAKILDKLTELGYVASAADRRLAAADEERIFERLQRLGYVQRDDSLVK
jgi:adenylylsulfate kinase